MNEQWKSIPDFEGMYECSNSGKVKSLKRKGKKKDQILAVRLDNYGYQQVYLCKPGLMKTARVHVLVAKLFVDNPNNKPHVNHLDGNKSNPHYLNLEWCTHSENHKHAYLAGLKKMPSTKLSHKEVLAIYGSKDDVSALALEYGVSKRTICQIRIGQTWQHVTGGSHKANKKKL